MTSLDAEHLPWLARTKDKKTGQATHDLNPDSEDDDSSSLRRKIPNVPVPDLRFEQSFLLTLKPFIKARNKQAEPEAVRPHGKVEAVDSLAMVQPVATNDVFAAHQLDIEWSNVVWITIRDQVCMISTRDWKYAERALQLLSPLAQGRAHDPCILL